MAAGLDDAVDPKAEVEIMALHDRFDRLAAPPRAQGERIAQRGESVGTLVARPGPV